MRSILAFFLIAIATIASSQDDDPFDITLYGSFLHTATVPNALFFFNDIEQYDSFELRRALRNHEIDTVVLGSNGGSVLEGLNMAGIIYDRGITTYVPELPNEMGCYSACAYMFFGGKIRQADGVLAVHQSGYYGTDADKSKRKVSEVQQNTQFTVSEIIGFLNEFETPPWVYEKMFRSRDFYIFDESEKKRLALRTDEIDAQNAYDINAFINSFLKYLADIEAEDKKKEKESLPKLSEEEELRLVVVEIQKLLNAAGCNAGIADGIWGRRTQAAAVLFAKTAKLPTGQDDLISAEFVKKLRKAPAKFCPQTKPTKTKTAETLSAEYGPLKGLWKLTIDCAKRGPLQGTYKMRLIGVRGQPRNYGIKIFDRKVGDLEHFGENRIIFNVRSTVYEISLINSKLMRGRSKSCDIRIAR